MSKKNQNKSADAGKIEKFPVQTQITLQDLATAVQIIDVVTKRGAFEGQELQEVGALRTKFVQYVNENSPKDTKGKPAAAEAPKPEDPTPPQAV